MACGAAAASRSCCIGLAFNRFVRWPALRRTRHEPSEHPHPRNRPMAARKSPSKTKTSRPTTVAAYLASLTPEKRAVIEEARAFIQQHLPKGYAEFMNWGVINWGIPLEEFSNTYNGQPLCYVALGAHKSYNSCI